MDNTNRRFQERNPLNGNVGNLSNLNNSRSSRKTKGSLKPLIIAPPTIKSVEEKTRQKISLKTVEIDDQSSDNTAISSGTDVTHIDLEDFQEIPDADNNEERKEEPISYQNEEEPISYQNEEESINYQNEEEPISYQNEEEPISYQNEEEPISYQNEEEPISYQNKEEPISYQNKEEPISYQNEEESISYQNEEESISYQNEEERISYQNEEESTGFQNEEESTGFQNEEEPTGFQNEEEPTGFQNEEESIGFQNEEESTGFHNEEESSNLPEAYFDQDFQEPEEFDYESSSEPIKLATAAYRGMNKPYERTKVRLPLHLADVELEIDIFNTISLSRPISSVSNIECSLNSIDAEVLLPSANLFTKGILLLTMDYVNPDDSGTMHSLKVHIPWKKISQVKWLHKPELSSKNSKEYMFTSPLGMEEGFTREYKENLVEKVNFSLTDLHCVWNEQFIDQDKILFQGTARMKIDLFQKQCLDLQKLLSQ
jgi:hypothetical protein